MEIKEVYPYMDEDDNTDEEVHFVAKKSELKLLAFFLDIALATPRSKFHLRVNDVQRWRTLFKNVSR